MATWSTDMVTMVRHLVNDTSEPYTYSDSKVQEALVISGLLVAQEYDFTTDYTFDIGTPSMSPDPIASSTYDGIAIALFTLKTACMLDTNRYQGAVLNLGVKVRDGDEEIDTRDGFRGYFDIINLGACKSYEKLITDKKVLKSMNLGKAIMGPISHEDLSRSSVKGVVDFFNSIRTAR